MKYVVQYTLPYEHRVMVGIEADKLEEAKSKAESLFDQGDIWQDTTEVPLLLDEFDETSDSQPRFTVELELVDDEPWPEPDESVAYLRRRDAAFQASRLLLEAYRRGEEQGGSIDWDDLDQAYQAALLATVASQDTGRFLSRQGCTQLAIVMEGGIVQAVIADQPDAAPAVIVVDYKVDGYETEDLCYVTQSDGSKAKALVIERCVEPAVINLDEVFQAAKS
jgi:hypothetical protein